ncbi:NVEALA domain-containing protein [uncultured Rikenella sp.]|uniref:NVEALA domain-containing protein n=1 Tax=uncultured Rikenella sp. TaxID=368003 RepID=UPI00262F4738|nr:NVEALA domain-containing protein [uncultured Rikenella sp.]
MRKKLFLPVGAAIALSAGVITVVNMTQRERLSDLMLLNIEAMANIETFARSASDCFPSDGYDCAIITHTGDGVGHLEVFENYAARNN